ncbi:MAG: TIGR01244 family phosphatase [Henriciella sp.]|jgi:sulfide:quinone oxidoreductase|uniref:TIGR01244 family sulfur transferase n=1 Tax=uncultured Henriciella sp. TaxID=1608424 RepID=UPI000C3E2D0D|nr:TIGR01244 family phosphatase [Henriciella sp.]|tara:strand:+ start:2199 stop:3941 length:1743 start_codon:yes stop_codon:yes gene_type:complete
MDIKTIAPDFSVSPQLTAQDVGLAASKGYRAILINRPDGEASEQPNHEEIFAAAERHGLNVRYIPVTPGDITRADVSNFATAMRELPAPVLAYCRTGTRSVSLWALLQAGHLSADSILKTASDAGYDISGLKDRLSAENAAGSSVGARASRIHDVLIIGGGAAGISTASSILKRRGETDIAIVEPKTEHYYQPGWTLVGGGVFNRKQTERPMDSLMPEGVKWIRSACAGFEPDRNQVVLEDGTRIGYRILVVAPGLKLDWEGVEGLRDTLGKNGVTSNYLFDMAPYTWELVQSLRGGKALFTQPPMPIKCAGAPQKAMYLACDAWKRRGVLKDIDVSFHNAGGVLFGVKEYVPALMEYVKAYGIDLAFNQTLVAVDGPAKKAWFDVKDSEGNVTRQEQSFDMLHVCPPQTALDFVAKSPLANDAGWVDVDAETLQHNQYGNVFGLGDAGSTPNAKTAAAVRKQAPVAAHNIVRALDGKAPTAVYSGYGSCPLTVERGKIVLAEFAYGGKLEPTLPKWMMNGEKPTRSAWFLKAKMLPWIYFDMMLRGKETLASPKVLTHRPASHEAQDASGQDNKPGKVA